MTSVAERNRRWAALQAEWNTDKSLRDRFAGNFSKFCFWRRSTPRPVPHPAGVPAAVQPRPTTMEGQTMTNDANVAAETIREWKENPALRAQYASVAEYHDTKVAGASASPRPVSRTRAAFVGKPRASSTGNGKNADSGPLLDKLQIEKGIKQEWESQPALRAEFTSFVAYRGFRLAEAKKQGLVV